MGKKKNKKFKQSYHSTDSNSGAMAQPTSITMNNSSTASSTEKITPTESAKPDLETELTAKYAYVRKDVLKLGIVIASLAIIFTGIYIIGQKTTVLANVGDWIYKIGNFQI